MRRHRSIYMIYRAPVRNTPTPFHLPVTSKLPIKMKIVCSDKTCQNLNQNILTNPLRVKANGCQPTRSVTFLLFKFHVVNNEVRYLYLKFTSDSSKVFFKTLGQARPPTGSRCAMAVRAVSSTNNGLFLDL